MEALTIHEAVPGHHLQISLAQELKALPKFRRHGGFTAFVEGWGLYSESLGDEMGFYNDPYSKFGQLTYEMWRAVRLVVDTGMHAIGWDRQRAIDFMKANTAKTEHDITVEIDRYIVWPGPGARLQDRRAEDQGAARAGGEGAGRALRPPAVPRRGPALAGALPLDVLESAVDGWIAKEKAGAKPSPDLSPRFSRPNGAFCLTGWSENRSFLSQNKRLRLLRSGAHQYFSFPSARGPTSR